MFKLMATKDNLGYTAPALTAMPYSPQKEPGKACVLKFNILLQKCNWNNYKVFLQETEN